LIIYNNKWNNDLNLLNKVDLSYKYRFIEKLSLLIGPSINVYVTKEEVDGQYGTLNIPYTILINEWSSSKVAIWIGINAGIAFKI